MFYQKYKPRESLSQTVMCYYIWEGYPTAPLNIESPPSGLSSITYNYKKPYLVSNGKYEKQSVPKFFVTGQALKNYTLHINGEIGVAGIVFKPTGLFHLTGIPMFGLTEERINFFEIFEKQSTNLKSQLSGVDTHSEKIATLERFCLGLLNSNNFSSKEITYAANEIYNAKGNLNVLDMIKSVYMSRRTFERKFLLEVGVSPKVYAKIRRFSYTCYLMNSAKEIDFMKVLHQGGYYDQSHFIKDFKYFAGRTPLLYSKNNAELANYVDGVKVVEQMYQNFNQS